MFIAFEITAIVGKRGFQASIIENSIYYDNSYHVDPFSKMIIFVFIHRRLLPILDGS